MVMVSSTDNALLPSKLRGHDQEIMKVSSTDNALLPSKLRGHDQEIVKVSSFDTASLQKELLVEILLLVEVILAFSLKH
ncbi:hypothetical protein V6N11_083373 [Hibiscus sabdariffa]|uniref:Uncharacterized protein n=1 Tax=Hibiscus sabdariffa TaxID=183260 RepID=A0ABR2QLN4_9ROSI